MNDLPQWIELPLSALGDAVSARVRFMDFPFEPRCVASARANYFLLQERCDGSTLAPISIGFLPEGFVIVGDEIMMAMLQAMEQAEDATRCATRTAPSSPRKGETFLDVLTDCRTDVVVNGVKLSDD